MQKNILKICSSSFLVLALTAVQPALAAAQTASTAPQQQEVSEGSASLNWAGYVAQSGTYTSASGSWVVPTVSAATTGEADATWVGIGGVKSQDLIQVGTQALVENGTVTYNAWVETLPSFSKTVPLSIAPGDSISASLAEQSNDVWLVIIKDNTSGQQYQTTVAYHSSLSSAEWIEEMVSNANNTFRPLDAFGSVVLTQGSTVDNGQTETIAQSGAQPLQMINTQGQALATTAALGPDGASFSVERTSALPTVAVAGRRGRTGWRVVPTATSTGGTPQTITVYRQGAQGSGFVQYQLSLPEGFILRFMQMR